MKVFTDAIIAGQLFSVIRKAHETVKKNKDKDFLKSTEVFTDAIMAGQLFPVISKTFKTNQKKLGEKIYSGQWKYSRTPYS